MSIATDTSTVFDAALKLPRDKREELLRSLIVSLDTTEKSPDYDRLWAKEIESRWQAYEQGGMQAEDAEEGLAQIQKKLAERRGE